VDDDDDVFPPRLLRDDGRGRRRGHRRGRHGGGRRLGRTTFDGDGDDGVEVVETLVPDSVYVSRNALSHEECRMWIDYAMGDGDGGRSGREKSWEKVYHTATRFIAHRECDRMQKYDRDMSHRLYRRIEDVVDDISSRLNVVDERTALSKLIRRNGHRGHRDAAVPGEYRPITCNPNLRLYRYGVGQRFGRHVDESNDVDLPPTTSSSSSRSHRGRDERLGEVNDIARRPKYIVDRTCKMRTEMTVLFYLSSCRGGETRFHLPHHHRGGGEKSNGGGGTVAFEPEEGAVLLHVHGDGCLEHEAEPVLGGVKYVLRTDIVYGHCIKAERTP
ncbi:hypothetical protein ACHAXA_000409, partial [Cyclostephanos tholiformis]